MKTIRLAGRISWAVLLILSVSLLSGCLESSEDVDGVDFVFTTIDGEEKHLSDFYGKVIVLDLMGVGCAPCQYQMVELKKISENYSSGDVAIISIDVWVPTETAEDVQWLIEAFKEEGGIDLDWTFGLDDASGSIGDTYTEGGVPTIHIIDQKGNIYYSHYEYTDYSTIAAKIDELLT